MTFELSSARALLSRTPTVFRAMLGGLPDAWLDAHEGPGTWSPRDVVCHLADLERDAWLPRARTILDHGTERRLPGIERERFRTRYADAPLETALDDFESARGENLDVLAGIDLTDATLTAVGRHHVLGDVRLSELLSAWVVHDLTHLAQVARAMAAQYRSAVGPWIEFLSILRPREESRA